MMTLRYLSLMMAAAWFVPAIHSKESAWHHFDTLSGFDGCEEAWKGQRNLQTKDYTDYALSVATMRILEREPDTELDVSRLREEILDKEGRMSKSYKESLPDWKIMPSEILNVFIKYSCQYGKGGEGFEEFCSDGVGTALPKEASDWVLCLHRISKYGEDGERSTVVSELCDALSSNFDTITERVMDYYVENGLVKANMDPSTTPYQSSTSTERPPPSTTNVPATNSTTAAFEVGTVSSSQPQDEYIENELSTTPLSDGGTEASTHPSTRAENGSSTSASIEAGTTPMAIEPETEPATQLKSESSSQSTTHPEIGAETESSTYLPTETVMESSTKVPIEEDGAKLISSIYLAFTIMFKIPSDNSSVNEKSMLDSTSKIVKRTFKDMDDEEREFKDLSLVVNMDVAQHGRALEEGNSQVMAHFDGAAYFYGKAPSDEEAKNALQAAFSKKTFKKTFRSSTGESLSDLEEFDLVLDSDVSSEQRTYLPEEESESAMQTDATGSGGIKAGLFSCVLLCGLSTTLVLGLFA